MLLFFLYTLPLATMPINIRTEYLFLRRAINIPRECQHYGLVLEIFIQNCDGTRYKKRHEYPKPWWKHQTDSKSGMRQQKINKTIIKNKQTSHDIRRI